MSLCLCEALVSPKTTHTHSASHRHSQTLYNVLFHNVCVKHSLYPLVQHTHNSFCIPHRGLADDSSFSQCSGCMNRQVQLSTQHEDTEREIKRSWIKQICSCVWPEGCATGYMQSYMPICISDFYIYMWNYWKTFSPKSLWGHSNQFPSSFQILKNFIQICRFSPSPFSSVDVQSLVIISVCWIQTVVIPFQYKIYCCILKL